MTGPSGSTQMGQPLVTTGSVLATSTSAYLLASTIVQAIAAKLNGSAAGAPDRVGVVNGAIAWDECECGGGMLVIAPGRMFLSDEFPVENFAAQIPCSAVYVACDFIVQIIRCAPTQAADGTAPSTRTLDASAQIVLEDAYLVLQTVACTLAEIVGQKINDYAIRGQNFVGPEGGCVGSEILFTTSWLRQP